MKLGKLQLSAALLAIAMLAAACGSDDSTEASGTSPLSEFLGEDSFGFDPDDPEAQARYNEQELIRQEKIAECMSAEGFEYIPQDNSQFNFADFNDGLDYASREYAKKYGFGITTQYLPQSAVGPDLVGFDDSMFDEAAGEDPNQAIIEAMDQSTMEAYNAALWGDEPDFDFGDPETMTEEELAEQEAAFEWEPQGCYGEAYADQFNNNFFQEFQDELDEMYSAMEDDPRVVEVQQEIESCISDNGYDYSLDSDGFEKLYENWQDRLEEVDAETGGDPFETMTEEDFAAMSEDEIEAMFNVPQELTDAGKAILAELQAEETEMAVAVWDCGGSFGGDSEYNKVVDEVLAEYEQRFIDDNAERLEQYKG